MMIFLFIIIIFLTKQGRMKFQKAKEIYEKYLVLENIDPTLVSYYFCQQEFYLNQGITFGNYLVVKDRF